MIPDNVRTLSGMKIIEVSRTADALSASVEDMSVDHRGPNVTVAKEFLYGADVGTGLDQVRRERLAERVCGDSLRYITPLDGGVNWLGDARFVQVLPASNPAAWGTTDPRSRAHMFPVE